MDVEGLVAALEGRAYLADRSLALALHLALHLGRPLLLEGEAGVGKTEAAKAVAAVLGAHQRRERRGALRAEAERAVHGQLRRAQAGKTPVER